jgi:hypothetical protein
LPQIPSWLLPPLSPVTNPSCLAYPHCLCHSISLIFLSIPLLTAPNSPNLCSSSIADCLCNAGFWRNETNLTAARPAATTSPGLSNATAASATSTLPLQVTNESWPPPYPVSVVVECTPCPSGSHSAAGAAGGLAACICDASLYGDPAPFRCRQCPPGSSSAPGATALGDCECAVGSWANFSSPQPACVACPQFTTTIAAATSPSDCFCAAGAFGDPAEPDGCLQCPNGSTSLARSTSITDCRCYPGAAGSPDLGEPCEMCSNTTVPAAGGGRYCACPADTYANDPAAIAPKPDDTNGPCIPCPDNSFAPTGTRDKTACTCNAGYYREENFGPEETYPAGFACLPCAKNASTWTVATSCTCNAGYYPETAFSSSSAVVGVRSCLPCPAGTHGMEPAGRNLTDACHPCPANTTSPPGLVGQCNCLPGLKRVLFGERCA